MFLTADVTSIVMCELSHPMGMTEYSSTPKNGTLSHALEKVLLYVITLLLLLQLIPL